MKYLYFFICILTINVFAYEYKSIEISENKKNLSNEIYWILQRDHFQDSIDKTDFNKKYIQAIIEKLDKNRSYFTINEVNDFLEKSSRRNDNDTRDNFMRISLAVLSLLSFLTFLYIYLGPYFSTNDSDKL